MLNDNISHNLNQFPSPKCREHDNYFYILLELKKKKDEIEQKQTSRSF